jgi:uncharacterized protein YacL
MNRLLSLFGLAVAAVSAALGDIVVESLSNHAVFGPGHFTDGSTVDVVPAAIIGFVFFGAFLWRRVRDALRKISAMISSRTIARMLPAIFAMHMLLLFFMETLEQWLVLGRFLGGTIWLGGPTTASLALHVVICIPVALLGLAAARFLEPRAVRLIRTLLASAAFPVTAPVVRVRSTCPERQSRWTLLHEVAKRGPPAHLSI